MKPAPLVNIGSELSLLGLALHGSHNFAIDHETPNVLAVSLLDELLNEDVGFDGLESMNNAFSGYLSFSIVPVWDACKTCA